MGVTVETVAGQPVYVLEPTFYCINVTDDYYDGKRYDLVTLEDPETGALIATREVGNDRVETGIGRDNVNGGLGNDRIEAGASDDTLGGGRGDDILSAGPGDDVLNGGSGDDDLTGGSGADVFVFSRFTDGETDIVQNFREFEDVLRLSDVGGATAEDQFTSLGSKAPWAVMTAWRPPSPTMAMSSC